MAQEFIGPEEYVRRMKEGTEPSRQATQIHHVTGSDYSIIRGSKQGVSPLATPNDPSGFEAMNIDSRHVEKLQLLVKRLLAEVMQYFPQALQDNMASRLTNFPIYAHNRRGQFSVAYENIQLKKTGTSPRGNFTFEPISIPLPIIEGLKIQCTPERIDEEDPLLISELFHELVHAVTADATMNFTNLSEAIALRMQKDHYQPSQFYGTDFEWNAQNFTGNMGLNTSPYAIQRSSQSNRAMYIAATHALNNLEESTIGELCSQLTVTAHTPIQHELGFGQIALNEARSTKVINEVLGSIRANAFWQNILFKRMNEGAAQMEFPRKEKTEKLRFTVQSNPAFQELINGQWQSIQFICSDR